MEILRYLIKFFLSLSVGFFVFAIVWWIASLIVPGLSFRTLIPTLIGSNDGNGTKRDILPSPRQFKGLFSNASSTNNHYNVYVHGPAYNGYGNNSVDYYANSNAMISYVTYTTTPNGETVIDYSPISSADGGGTKSVDVGRSVYIRNLSIHGGYTMKTGLTFIGEARSTMFRNGIFPIVLVDANRRVIGISTARATSDWTVAGWTRFETVLAYQIPKVGPCTLVFEQALTDQEKAVKTVPIRVPINVSCK